MTLSITTLYIGGATTFSMTTFSTTTLSIMAFSIMAFRLMTISIMTFSINDTQKNSIQGAIMLSVVMLSVVISLLYAECHYGKCHYAECRGALQLPPTFSFIHKDRSTQIERQPDQPFLHNGFTRFKQYLEKYESKKKRLTNRFRSRMFATWI